MTGGPEIVARRRSAGRLRMLRRASVDDSAARKKAALAEANTKLVGERTVRELGTVFVDMIERVSPRDTNRFVRAYQMAGNDAGLPPRAVLPINPSSRRDEWIRALEKQAEYWQGQVRYYGRLIDLADRADRESGPKKNGTARKRRSSSPSYRRYQRERTKAEKEVDKSFATLREALGSEGFLLFDKGGFAEGRQARYGKRKRFRTTIRTKDYGGTGSLETVGTISLLTLHNREPHATIVARSARHGRPVDFALAAVRALGGETLRKSTADAIAAVSGYQRGRAGTLTPSISAA